MGVETTLTADMWAKTRFIKPENKLPDAWHFKMMCIYSAHSHVRRSLRKWNRLFTTGTWVV